MKEPLHHHPNFLTCPGVNELTNGDLRESELKPVARVSKTGRSATAEAEVKTFTPEETLRPVANLDAKTKPQKKRRRPRRIRWIVLACIVVIAILIGPAIFALARAGMAARSAQADVSEMLRAMSERDTDAASHALDRAYDDALNMRTALKGVGFWRNVPGVGTQIRALEDAAIAGTETLDGARVILGIAKDVLDVFEEGEGAVSGLDASIGADRSFKDLAPDEKRMILAKLNRAIPDMRSAQARIDVALEAWNRIPQDRLFAPLKTAFAPVAESLPRLKKTIDEALPILEVMVPLAGYPEPADYIVLLQNSDELRATGGFIGTVGAVRLNGGDIESFTFDDVYNIDNPVSASWSDPAPEALKRYLGAPILFLRDANWSPDFPTSAERIMEMYRREIEAGTGVKPEDTDGVIAINPPLFKELLRMVGPITIDGITFEPETFFDVLEYEVEIGFLKKGIPREQRKALLSKLGDELLNRLTSLPISKWESLFDLLTQSLERKQMLMYVRHPEALARLDEFGWTGRTLPTDGDYLWIVDSNLAALKTDAVVQKEVVYSVDAQDSKNITATVTLRYTNNASGYGGGEGADYKYTRYRSYTRVYVPEGAELVSSSGAMKDDRYRTGGRFVSGDVDVYRELGKTVFGAFWSIEPKTSQELSFTYRLPASVADQIEKGSYRLDWQKQAGNDNAGLTLDLLFDGAIRNADPPEPESQWGDASYRVESNTLEDRKFNVTF